MDRGWDAFNEGDLQLGLDRMAEGAQIAEQLADRNLQANSLRNQAVLQLDREDAARVRGLLEDARAVYKDKLWTKLHWRERCNELMP